MASKTAPLDMTALHLPLQRIAAERRAALVARQRQRHADGDARDPEPESPAAARTAPSLGDQYHTPECPYCKSTRHVHRFGWWHEYENVVWYCSKLRKRGDVATVCAYAWREPRTIAKCFACRASVTIQRHGDTLGYWCSKCRTFGTE